MEEDDGSVAEDVQASEPTPAQKLAAEYDHTSASGFDPTEFPTLSPPPEEPAAEPTRAAPPKDPVTGKFVKAAPPPPEHSPRLVRMAQQLGIQQDQISGMTPDALESVIETLHGQILSAHRDSPRSPQWQQNAPPPPEAEVDPIPELKDDEWDAKLTGPIKQVVRGLQKQVKELEAKLGLVQQSHKRQAEESHSEAVDRIIESFGDERFGKGPMGSLGNTPATSRRLALHAEAIRLAGGQNATGRGILAKLAQARENLYGETEEPAPEKNGAKPRFTAEQWNGAGLSRPTSRGNNPEPKTRESAIRKVARQQQQMVSESGGDPVVGGDEEDTMPE